MGALFDFKCTCDSTLVYVCQADAEKCIFVWTILSQTPRRTPQVTSDAGRISARIFWLFAKERRMLRKRDYQGRLSFHFFDRWMTDLATHRQKKVQAMSWKNLQMLEFILFTWSWMGPINCAPNPYASGEQVLIDCCTYRGNYLLKQRSKPRLICRSLEGTTPLGPYNATRGFTL